MIARFERPVLSKKGQTFFYKCRNLNNLPHWHTENEIAFVVSGNVEINVNNHDYSLTEGMCAFFKSGEIHQIKGTPDSIIQVVKTSVGTVSEIIREKSLLSPVLQNNQPVIQCFYEIEKELKSESEYNDIVADSISTYCIARMFREEETVLAREIFKPEEDYKKLMMWISEHYNHINFSDAASYMNFSKPYFSKYFQNLTGIKFSQYLNILRVSAAVEKITAGEKNMTTVSVSCGFGTIRNFNRIFKLLTGYTPNSLPTNYHYPYIIAGGDHLGYDPTLSESEFL
ncbi:MAG: AraC family transcriptional regulator [Ruminococcaceae bacterium]|nr:AraC family transcriptional regulator [Oscillospiraceae bacterium]